MRVAASGKSGALNRCDAFFGFGKIVDMPDFIGGDAVFDQVIADGRRDGSKVIAVPEIFHFVVIAES